MTTQTPPHIAVSNFKGGDGKTLLIQAIALEAARRGLTVLVVDMDPQANITERLRARRPARSADQFAVSLAAILQEPTKGCAKEIITRSELESIGDRILIAPAHLDLSLLEASAGRPSSEKRLLRALYGVPAAFDVDLVLIDCRPDLVGHLIDLAWSASDYVLVATKAERDSVKAALKTTERVEQDKDLLNPDLHVLGYVINQYRGQTKIHRKRAGDLIAHVGRENVCPTRIPLSVSIGDAAETESTDFGPFGLWASVYDWMMERIAHHAAV